MPPRAKRHLGQHFLRDTGTLERIVRLIHPQPDEAFLEIGPGDGALTARLARSVSRLIAIEVDPDCCAVLRREGTLPSNAVLVQDDILAIDLKALWQKHFQDARRTRVAGNLPYNIATAIIERMLRAGLSIADMTFMLQMEVAERLAAAPGTRSYGYISVICRHLADVEIQFHVSPACFVPRPKVRSSVVVLKPRLPSGDPGFESSLTEVTKAAFSHRRKTLANALGYHPVLGSAVEGLLEEAGIDGSRRAEELSVDEFRDLARAAQRLL